MTTATPSTSKNNIDLEDTEENSILRIVLEQCQSENICPSETTLTSTTSSTNKIDLIDIKVKMLLKTVLEQCLSECIKSSLSVPLEAVEQRASYYTRFPTDCFFEFDIANKTLLQATSLKVSQKIIMLNNFKDLYACKKKFTFHEISKLFIKIGLGDSVSPFVVRRELCALGYEYKQTTSYGLIVENPKLRYERFHYINKIINYRDKNKPICYIDVRVIDKSLQFEKFSSSSIQDYVNMDKFYFVHAINRNGYINGIFCNVIDREIFTKWVADILVTMLAPDSVIVIDNGNLYNEKIKPITRYSSKKDMFQWLIENNIPCSSSMHKPELYELITRSEIKTCQSKIDNILKAHGHDVLRTPEKFHDLNATELFWDYMRTAKYDIKDQTDIVLLKQAVEKHIANCDKLEWKRFTDVISNHEKEIFEVDVAIENLLDSYEFEEDNIDESSTIPEYFFSDS